MTDDTEAQLSDKARKQRMTPPERAAANPGSMRLAISAFCYVCQDDGASQPHVTRGRVRDCNNKTCQLWRQRGFQKVTTGRQAPSPK